MPAATFYQPVEKLLNGNCSYEYYNQSTDSYSTSSKSRICHVVLNNESERNKDIILMNFPNRILYCAWLIPNCKNH